MKFTLIIITITNLNPRYLKTNMHSTKKKVANLIEGYAGTLIRIPSKIADAKNYSSKYSSVIYLFIYLVSLGTPLVLISVSFVCY